MLSIIKKTYLIFFLFWINSSSAIEISLRYLDTYTYYLREKNDSSDKWLLFDGEGKYLTEVVITSLIKSGNARFVEAVDDHGIIVQYSVFSVRGFPDESSDFNRGSFDIYINCYLSFVDYLNQNGNRNTHRYALDENRQGFTPLQFNRNIPILLETLVEHH